MKIAIAGASGFVGHRLIEALRQEHSVVALGRVPPAGEGSDAAAVAHGEPGVEWRACDLFSLLQAERALAGVEVAYYLVHSMLPTARLFQGDFADADLLLADNFARAARAAGVKRIIYLGGLIPEGPRLSHHLESRLEVERALASQGASVTTLRAGLILGAEGSSFQMLYLLVKRLPVMLCPRWTLTRTQCIDARDVTALLKFCLGRPVETSGRTFDVGGGDVVSYRDLMAAVALGMGLRRRFLSVPLFTPGLSSLWVRLVTGGSRNLVKPLIASLRHEMIVRDRTLLELYGKPLRPLAESLRDCLAGIHPQLRAATRKRRREARARSEVRSISRLPLPAGRTAEWLSAEYFRWAPSRFAPVIRLRALEGSPSTWRFELAALRLPLLELQASRRRSTVDRQLYYIRGGMLSRRRQNESARLEFREVPSAGCALASIHDYGPSLPWLVYSWTQSPIHFWVMRGFERHLRGRGSSWTGRATVGSVT